MISLPDFTLFSTTKRLKLSWKGAKQAIVANLLDYGLWSPSTLTPTPPPPSLTPEDSPGSAVGVLFPQYCKDTGNPTFFHTRGNKGDFNGLSKPVWPRHSLPDRFCQLGTLLARLLFSLSKAVILRSSQQTHICYERFFFVSTFLL